MAGPEVLPSGGEHPLYIWGRQDYLCCSGKSSISLSRSDLVLSSTAVINVMVVQLFVLVMIFVDRARSARVDLICSTQWH